MPKIPEIDFENLKKLFSKVPSQTATKPLREGIEIAVYINESGPVTLSKSAGRAVVTNLPPIKPDMTFWATSEGVKELAELETDEIGEIGIAICKQLLSKESNKILKAKVHIGTFDLLRNGYLGVIPLGGTALMKFLGSQGLGGIGKIKDAIAKFRS